MKNQKASNVVMTILFLTLLTFLSKHPFDIAVLFGSAYLLRWQAGGITFQKCYKNLAAITAFWIMGIVSYPFVCPIWVLYPFLLLINTTIYFLAPATNQVLMTDEAAKAMNHSTDTERSETTEAQAIKNATKELIKRRQQKKIRSLFITGVFSIATIITYKTPISSLLLVTLLAQMVSILGVIWEALQKQPWEL